MTLPRRWLALLSWLALASGLTFIAAKDTRPAAAAVTLPAGFKDSLVAVQLSNATAMAFSPDGRLFVAEQIGALRVIKGGVLLPAPFVSVTTDSQGERGLLGIAFDPDFANTPYVYVYYTVPATTNPVAPPHNRVSRFTANGDLAVGAETAILDLEDLSSATNHNGGAIHFGIDGKLYIAVGENANSANSQTLNNRLGKMLRINKDGTIPNDNPFLNAAAGANRSIWALGLRNPFTFAFQPGTGRMFINDVGHIAPTALEEINDGIAGSNYGWPTCEGACSPANAQLRDPLFNYDHVPLPGPDSGCAIAGGAFYNPAVQMFPASYIGDYFYADLCSGWIRRFDPGTGTSAAFAEGIAAPVDLAVGPDGALYYLARGSNSVGRVAFGVPNAPVWAGAVPISTTEVELIWVDNSENESGFNLYKLVNGAWSQIGTVGGNVTTFTAPGLSAGRHYQFLVLSVNNAGWTSSPTLVASITQGTWPSPPAMSFAVGTSTSQIDVGWRDNSSNENGFNVYRLNQQANQWELRATLPANTTSYTDSGVGFGSYQAYTVGVFNASGEVFAPAPIYAYSLLGPADPVAPRFTAATALSNTQTRLDWTDGTANETGFTVFRWGSAGWVQVGSVGPNVATFTDSGLTQGTVYVYEVRASGPGYVKSSPIFLVAETLRSNPTSPLITSAFGESQSQIKINWSDTSNNESGFRIWRYNDSTGQWQQRGQVGANSTTFTDTGMPPNAYFAYFVVAFNGAGDTVSPQAIVAGTWP